MRPENKTHQSEKDSPLEYDRVKAIGGYAFVGAWIGLILGFTGAVGPNHSSEVSFALAILGAVVGRILIGHANDD